MELDSAPVLVRTLGGLDLINGDHTTTWRSSGVGANQLRRMTALLVLRTNQYVSKTLLVRVAGGQRGARPNRNLTGALRAVLHGHGLAPAIDTKIHNVCLRTHPCWQTDTSRLTALVGAATAAQARAAYGTALEMLIAATEYCGGLFLPILETPSYLPDLDIERLRWLHIQADVATAIADVMERWNEFRTPHGCHAAIRAASTIHANHPQSSPVLPQIEIALAHLGAICTGCL